MYVWVSSCAFKWDHNFFYLQCPQFIPECRIDPFIRAWSANICNSCCSNNNIERQLPRHVHILYIHIWLLVKECKYNDLQQYAVIAKTKIHVATTKKCLIARCLQRKWTINEKLNTFYQTSAAIHDLSVYIYISIHMHTRGYDKQ